MSRHLIAGRQHHWGAHRNVQREPAKHALPNKQDTAEREERCNSLETGGAKGAGTKLCLQHRLYNVANAWLLRCFPVSGEHRNHNRAWLMPYSENTWNHKLFLDRRFD